MISVDDARALVEGAARPPCGTEELPLGEAAGRVLARPLHARRDDPPFDRAMMDGYALRAADLPGRLEVIGRIAAGDAGLPEIGPGQAAWINTGAPVPPGADTVVAVERTRGEVEVEDPQPAGANILVRGSLARRGAVVAEGRLTPGRLAVCASHLGAGPLRVFRRPRVALLSTGSELREEPGALEIRDSNGPMLAAMVGRLAEIVEQGVAGDRPGALDTAIARGLKRADVFVATGGVSKGEFDLVRPALERAGAEVVFHGVALQPGKPVLFARHPQGLVFGLPGNPVSAMVCADLFLLPCLAALGGRAFDATPVSRTARLSAPAKGSPVRRRLLPCVLAGAEATPLAWRGSADLYSLGEANAYLVLEPGMDRVAGEEVLCLVPER